MILIHTIGQNDVQIVASSPERRRWRIKKNFVSAFSGFLKEHSNHWMIAGELPDEFTRGELEWLPDAKILVSPLSHLDDASVEIDCSATAQERFEVSCPLIEKLFEKISQTTHSEFDLVLLLDTRRQNTPTEPSYYCDVVKRWLVERQEIAAESILQVTYLTEGRLEQLDATGQDVVRADCAKAISDAFASARKSSSFSSANSPAVLINDSGGLPGAKGVIRAAARFHFGVDAVRMVRSLEIQPEQVCEVIAPEDSFDDRRRAWNAIQNGDFNGAARIALAPGGETTSMIPGTSIPHSRATRLERWRQEVIAASEFFQGDVRPLEYLPGDCQAKSALMQISEYGFVALNAIRVENALRQQQYPEAIKATVCFYETCEKDPWINQHLIEPHLSPGTPADEEHRLKLVPVGIDFRRRIYATNTPISSLTMEMLANLDPKTAAHRKTYRDTLTFHGIRNLVTHHAAYGELITAAKRIAESTDVPGQPIWGNEDTYRFLKVPLIAELCGPKKSLASVADLYSALLKAIQNGIHNFPSV